MGVAGAEVCVGVNLSQGSPAASSRAMEMSSEMGARVCFPNRSKVVLLKENKTNKQLYICTLLTIYNPTKILLETLGISDQLLGRGHINEKLRFGQPRRAPNISTCVTLFYSYIIFFCAFQENLHPTLHKSPYHRRRDSLT